ncbi:tripartite motif-containing protein 16-like [Neosynchiropus ocellatus]
MERRVDLQRESFTCSICLHILEDPVTLHCGHSFCKICVDGSWNDKNIYKCPHCRQTFTPRPVLQKNIMLAEIVEELKKTGLHAADPCCAGDVDCESCTDKMLEVLKSCTACLVSYCDRHLQPRLEEPTFRRHSLVHTRKQVRDVNCCHHGVRIKVFCHLCAKDQAKEHNSVLSAVQRRAREKELDLIRQRIKQRIQVRYEDVKLLQSEEKKIAVSADRAVKDSLKILNHLFHTVEQQIRSRQQSEASRVRCLQEQLEQEIAELEKRDAELQQLSHIDNHAIFLQNLFSLSEPDEETLDTRTRVHRHCSFEEVAAVVSASKVQLQDFMRDQWTKTSLMLTPDQRLLSEDEPKTRAEFLKYSQGITLDPNTASSRLFLSEGKRKLTDMRNGQSNRHHPDRFTDYLQVLSKETLTGRCYWEVERTGEVEVAVTYRNISRSAAKSRFGFNDKSWSLFCFNSGCTFTHNSIVTEVSSVPSSRIGVYLDHCAGLLSFYRVYKTMTLLHRVHTRFTQPLHAGVSIWFRSTSEFPLLK